MMPHSAERQPYQTYYLNVPSARRESEEYP